MILIYKCQCGIINIKNKRNQHQRYYNIYKTLNYIFIHSIYSIFQFIQASFHCFRLKAQKTNIAMSIHKRGVNIFIYIL